MRAAGHIVSMSRLRIFVKTVGMKLSSSMFMSSNQRKPDCGRAARRRAVRCAQRRTPSAAMPSAGARAGSTAGRPLCHIGLNVGDCSGSTASASFFAARSGCFGDTRRSGVTKLSIVVCSVSVPGTLTSARNRSNFGFTVDPQSEFHQPARCMTITVALTCSAGVTQTLLLPMIRCALDPLSPRRVKHGAARPYIGAPDVGAGVAVEVDRRSRRRLIAHPLQGYVCPFAFVVDPL